eukprot:gene1039-593_t
MRGCILVLSLAVTQVLCQLKQTINDCQLGQFFIQDDLDQQPCFKLGQCEECNSSDSTSVFIPELNSNTSFPTNLVPGQYCAPGLAMPWTYFDPQLSNLSNPADLTFERMTVPSAYDADTGFQAVDENLIILMIQQLAIFNCVSSQYCPNFWTACNCSSGKFCLNGFSSEGKCTFGAGCDGGPSKEWGYGVPLIFGGGIAVVVLILLFLLRWSNQRKIKSLEHLYKRKKAEDYINKLRVGAGFGAKTNVIETLRGLTDKLDPVVISTIGLSMQLKASNKYVLRDVSAHFPPASLNAVMGASGAGKTTFMNALAGRATYGNISGEIFIDGVDMRFDSENAPSIGYVPQDDIMHDHLTVYQNLYYSAMLRLPRDMPKKQKLRIIDDVVLVLELDHLIDQRVGNADSRGISGGQKKRVNIGMELCAYPRVLFLDEPTSGLDSTASIKVCQCLKRLTSLGITVICVIHQPRYSIFRAFDNVLLLGKGGQTVYQGSTHGIDTYLQSLGFMRGHGENIADWMIDVTSGFGVRFSKAGSDDSPGSKTGRSSNKDKSPVRHRTFSAIHEEHSAENSETSSVAERTESIEQNIKSQTSSQLSATTSPRSPNSPLFSPKNRKRRDSLGETYELEDLFDEWYVNEEALIQLIENSRVECLATRPSRQGLSPEQVSSGMESDAETITTQEEGVVLPGGEFLPSMAVRKKALPPMPGGINLYPDGSLTKKAGTTVIKADSDKTKTTELSLPITPGAGDDKRGSWLPVPDHVGEFSTQQIIDFLAAGDMSLMDALRNGISAPQLQKMIHEKCPDLDEEKAELGDKSTGTISLGRIFPEMVTPEFIALRDRALENHVKVEYILDSWSGEDLENAERQKKMVQITTDANASDIPHLNAPPKAIATFKEKVAPRRDPTMWKQMFIMLHREFFMDRGQQIQYLICLIALAFGSFSVALILSFTKGTEEDNYSRYSVDRIQPPVLLFGIAASVASTDVISESRLTWARESVSGISGLAYFFAKDIRPFVDVVLNSLVWCAPWFFLTLPNIDIGQAWVIFGLIAYMGTGSTFMFASLFSKKWALMIGVMFPCLMGILYAGLNPTYPQMNWASKVISYFSFGRYAYPLYIVMDIRRLPAGFPDLPSIVALSTYYGWPIDFATILWTAFGLLGMGLVFRFAAFIIIMSTKGGESFFSVFGAKLWILSENALGVKKNKEGKVKWVLPKIVKKKTGEEEGEDTNESGEGTLAHPRLRGARPSGYKDSKQTIKSDSSKGRASYQMSEYRNSETPQGMRVKDVSFNEIMPVSDIQPAPTSPTKRESAPEMRDSNNRVSVDSA